MKRAGTRNMCYFTCPYIGVLQMQTADLQTGRLYVVLPLLPLIANRKQANRSVI